MPSDPTRPGPPARLVDSSQLAGDPEVLSRIFEFAPDAKLFVDGEGRILEVNAQAEQMFGYSRGELVGQPVEILLPERFAGRHVHYRSGYMSAPRMRPMGAGVELFALRKDGTEIPVDIMLGPLETRHGTLALAVVRDISERKRIEAQAQRARETYLKELHHRVKNNLQVISSLLFLQSTYTTDPKALEILKESQGRVKSIALIHEKLYRSPELTRIGFAEYARDLATDLFRTYGAGDQSIALDLQVEDVSLEIDTAIPCGLMINELVSNALKHAFPGGRRGRVSIRLAATCEREFTLTVADDGVGLRAGYDPGTSTSLGLKLVTDLARQLDGAMQIEVNSGTTFRITFKEIQYKDRS